MRTHKLLGRAWHDSAHLLLPVAFGHGGKPNCFQLGDLHGLFVPLFVALLVCLGFARFGKPERQNAGAQNDHSIALFWWISYIVYHDLTTCQCAIKMG